jgi:tRNA modification GTPase
MPSFSDTIVALSTPPGLSGIGIVRLSGPEAVPIAARLFRPAHPGKRLASLPTFTLAYGHVHDGAAVVDEALISVMRGPHTYTTQDVVEINCHGGLVPVRRTLELALREGARLAEPGEFTYRAFHFGRIDLAQAEAVADLITAQTEQAAAAALAQLSGELSARVEDFRARLASLLAQIQAQLDFGEDDIESLTLPELAERLQVLAGEVADLAATADRGKLLRQGARVALLGRPNVGKSSLMNALLGEERVIVTACPGTTRDTVAENLNLRGVPVVLVDTAGLREGADEVEQAGVDRARRAGAEADLVLLVLDRAAPLDDEDRELLGQTDPARTLLVLNKCDLEAAATVPLPLPAVEVSARTHAGLDRLRDAIAERLGAALPRSDAPTVVTNVRHQQALLRAGTALTQAAHQAQTGATEEYLAEDLQTALEALGEITGATSREQIINEIFEKFCIGK